MNPFRAIRERLGLTQSAIGAALGVTQGNVSLYEKGQTVPPAVARKLIRLCRSKRLLISYEHIYDGEALPRRRARQPAPLAAARP